MSKSTLFVDRRVGATLSLTQEGVQAYVDAHVRLDAGVQGIKLLKQGMSIWSPPKVTVLPGRLGGRLLVPDGTPARGVAVTAQAPSDFAGAWPNTRVATDAEGNFSLPLPAGRLPEAGLTLRITGTRGAQSLTVPRASLATGDAGTQFLRRDLGGGSALAELGDIVEQWSVPEPMPELPGETTSAPAVHFGEGDCATAFREGSGITDRFCFSVVYRLVSPELWPPPLVSEIPVGDGRLPVPVGAGEVRFATRAPVVQPLDVTALREALADAPEELPMAGSIGLGYVLHFEHTWAPAGYSLGNLVYSLALAPGERQVIGVMDRRQSLDAMDRESLTAEERLRVDESRAETATEIFHATLRDHAHSHTDFWQDSSTGGGGGGINLLGFVTFGGGGSSSSASGGESSVGTLSRDLATSAVDSFHGEVHRRASAARSTDHVSVRTIHARERTSVATRIIENHNRAHALTMQFWEVFRHFTVTTRPRNVQLTAFVPLLPIRWLPEGHDDRLPDFVASNTVFSRANLLARYEVILRYADLLRRAMPRASLKHGIDVLRRFAGDAAMTLENPNTVENLLTVEVTGSFLPWDELEIVVVARGQRVVGRALLQPVVSEPNFNAWTAGPDVKARFEQAPDRESFLGAVREMRERPSAANATRKVTLTLPPGLQATELVRVELRYRAHPLSHSPPSPVAELVEGLSFAVPGFDTAMLEARPFRVEATALMEEVGGPFLTRTRVVLGDGIGSDPVLLDVSAARRISGTVPWPVAHVAWTLRMSELAQIEAVLQHVRSTPMVYTRALWLSLTPEERALLLEPFTIAMPGADASDPLVDVPLLDCVDNTLLGLNGNCLVLPFHIPERLETTLGFDTRSVQDALLRFHTESFRLRVSNVALRTKGVLGEAVLGGCTSAERIDLTRFWNWQDGFGASGIPEASLADLAALPDYSLLNTATPTGEFAVQGVTLPTDAAPGPASTSVLASTLGEVQGLLEAKNTLGSGTVLKDLNELLLGSVKDGKFVPGLLPENVNKVVSDTSKLADGQADLFKKLINRDQQAKVDALKAEKAAREAETAATPAAATPPDLAAGVSSLTDNAQTSAEWVQSLDSAARAGAVRALVHDAIGSAGRLSSAQKVALFKAFKDSPGENNAADPNAAAKALFRAELQLSTP